MKKLTRSQIIDNALADAVLYRESYLESIRGCIDMGEIQKRTEDRIAAYKAELSKRGITLVDPFANSKTISLRELRERDSQ